MKLYMHPFSQHARRVLMLCHELDLSIETVPVALDKGEHRTPEFLSINPDGKIPVLVDGDTALPESHAIMKYLAVTANAPTAQILYPAAPRARAEVDRWLDWNHTRLNPPVQALAIQTLVMGENADQALVARSHEEAAAALIVFDQALADRPAGQIEPTLADLSIASTVALYRICGGKLASHAAVSLWLERISRRPSFQNTEPKMGG